MQVVRQTYLSQYVAYIYTYAVYLLSLMLLCVMSVFRWLICLLLIAAVVYSKWQHIMRGDSPVASLRGSRRGS